MRLVSTILAVTLAAVGLVAGCGSKPEPATPAPAGSQAAPAGSQAAPAGSHAAAPAASGELPAVWKHDMPKEQQIAFMKAKVMPPMTKVMQEHDAKKYADVSCKTCHGPNYKEPKEFLPKLTMKDGKITSFADKPEVSKWMAEKVVPAMAQAMGMKPYDPATKQGFGCGGCHAIEMK